MAGVSEFIGMLLLTVCTNYQDENGTLAVGGAGDPGCILKEPRALEGVTIRIATLEDFPLSHTELDDGSGDRKGMGIVFEFVDILAEIFGFNYEVIVPEKNVLGDENEGIFGLLKQQKADMAAAFLPVLESERHLVNYSVSLAQADWVILMRRPSESATGSGLLAPFDNTVWILILVSLILVGPTIHIIILIRVKLCKGSEKLTKIFPLHQCIWFVYGALMKQGSTLSPISDSSRLLFATWWIFITILTSFYTANLTAFLTLSRFTLPIDDARGLAKLKYKWMAQAGGAIEKLLQTNPDFEYLNNSLRDGKGRFVDLKNEEMLKEISDTGHMYINEYQAAEYTMFRDYLAKTKNNVDEGKRCTFVATPQPFMVTSLAFAFRNNSELKNLIDPILTSLVETGIVKHLLKRDLPQTEICPLNLGSKERQLRNSDLLMTYMIVVGGFVVAAAVFLSEMIFRLLLGEGRPKLTGWSNPPSDEATHSKAFNIFGKKPVFAVAGHPPPYNEAWYTGGGAMRQDLRKRQVINGRDYFVVNAKDGDTTLIPVRTPSAFLFQYTS